MLNDIQPNFLGRCWPILYRYSWLTLCHHVAFATCQFVKDNDNFCRFLVKGSVLGKSKQSDFQHYTPLMRSDRSFELWVIILFCCFHGMDNCFLRNNYWLHRNDLYFLH